MTCEDLSLYNYVDLSLILEACVAVLLGPGCKTCFYLPQGDSADFKWVPQGSSDECTCTASRADECMTFDRCNCRSVEGLGLASCENNAVCVSDEKFNLNNTILGFVQSGSTYRIIIPGKLI